jgi:sec-independent protein translocase protein TatA
MFGSIGFPELMVILIIALLVFGPKKLPEVGRSIGKAMREFRKTTDEIKGRIEDEIQADEFRNIKKDFDDVKNTRFDIDSDQDKPKNDPYTSQSEEQGKKQKREGLSGTEKKTPKSESGENKASGPSSKPAEDHNGTLDDHGEGEKNS